jgi:hypothetical protein
MRSAIGKDIDQTTNLQVTVDEKQVMSDRLKRDFRVQSPVFTAKLPDGNILQANGYEQIVAGTYWGVDDGVYVMLKPLAPGDHTIKFQGRFPQYDFDLDFTYHIKVVGAAVPGDFNGDGAVTYDDLYDYFLPAYGTQTGDPGYVAEFDMNSNGVIDMSDYSEWYACYMKANQR